MTGADTTTAWDYIIIGAGTAGCILANRLTADGRSKVLVIEAGGEDNKLRYKLVALSTDCMNNPESDGMFLSEPDPTRSGKVDLMSPGNVIGGSSSINGSIYVPRQSSAIQCPATTCKPTTSGSPTRVR